MKGFRFSKKLRILKVSLKMHQKKKISCSYKSNYLVLEKLTGFKLIRFWLGSYDFFFVSLRTLPVSLSVSSAVGGESDRVGAFGVRDHREKLA